MKEIIRYKPIIILVLFFSRSAISAQKEHKMGGVVEKVSSNSITINTDHELFDIPTTDSHFKLPQEVQVGDWVTVWYTLSPSKILINKAGDRKGKQQPGQLDLQKQNTDDRAIYFSGNKKLSPDQGTNHS